MICDACRRGEHQNCAVAFDDEGDDTCDCYDDDLAFAHKTVIERLMARSDVQDLMRRMAKK